MSNYESVLIARQDLGTSQVNNIVSELSDVIKKEGGEVVKVDNWGLKNLAYRIKKNRKGHYVLMNISAPANAIAEFERIMRFNEDIIRYMTVKVEEFNDLFGVLHMALDAQRQRLGALQEQESVERRDGSAGVAEKDCADIGYESSRADSVREGDAVVTRVRVSDRSVLAGSLPVELAGIDDNAAEGCAVTADELGCGMYNDVSTVLDWSYKIRCCKCIIYNKRDFMLMCDICDCFNINYI